MSRVLLSAYACFGNHGSEPGVGMLWLGELLNKGLEVTLLTSGWSFQRLTKEDIVHDQNLQIIVVGSVRADKFFRKIRLLYQFYLLYWQCIAFFNLRLRYNYRYFDVAHHLTYGGVTIPSFVAPFGRRSIYGPIGGAERAPIGLAKAMGPHAVIQELLKSAYPAIARRLPSIWLTRHSFSQILLKNQDNLHFFADVQHKCTVSLEIADVYTSSRVRSVVNQPNIDIIFAARGVYWKGGAFAIKAFASLKLKPGFEGARLHFYGDGKEYSVWKRISEGISGVKFHGKLDRQTFLERKRGANIVWFPSIHDSSGNVILESLVEGTPVIAFRLGGPSAVIHHDEMLVEPYQAVEKSISDFVEKTIAFSLASVAERQAIADYYRAEFNIERLTLSSYGDLSKSQKRERRI